MYRAANIVNKIMLMSSESDRFLTTNQRATKSRSYNFITQESFSFLIKITDMKKSEFSIGLNFYTATGKWRCTDVGTRIIVAIHLNQEDINNYNGPPYSIAECVFDENDIEGCSLDSGEFDEDVDKNVKSQKFNEIYDAFLFVSSASCGENSATLDKRTGNIYFHSYVADLDELEELPEDKYDSEIHIDIPHKNDLDLGRSLVFEFVAKSIPGEENKISQIFKRKGAYSRYKDFLDSRGVLQEWYDYENQREQQKLMQWCKENEIDML